MSLPFRQLHSMDDVQQNFEAIEGWPIMFATGNPITNVPVPSSTTFCFRLDTPSVANQRIYVSTGGSWVGIV